MPIITMPRNEVTVEQLRACELEEARAIQQAMVTLEPLERENYEVAVLFRPAAEVGGDFLDYFILSDRRLAFYVGDVVGKGLAAAMYAALSVGTLRGINKTGARPTDVLEMLNERLRMRVMPGRYCAVQYAVYDPPRRELTFSNAAMPLPLHVRGSDVRELGGGGLPSGMFGDAHYDMHSVQLAPGEAVLFTTDGLLEATNREGEHFGSERLAEVCAQAAGLNAGGLMRRVLEEALRFADGSPQTDDMTVLVLKAR